MTAAAADRRFAGSPHTPAAARSFAADALAAYPDRELVDDVLTIISELVTNAVRAAAVIRVEVVDDAPGWPKIQHPALDGTSGRGLLIVSALTHSWGTSSLDRDTKAVWATVAPTVPPAEPGQRVSPGTRAPGRVDERQP
jgi:hypothetical protein